MRYNPPFGSTDPNAPYVDRNTPGAVAGSKVPARAIEDTQREIVDVITAAGLTPSPSDLTQLAQIILAFASETARGRVELATAAETRAGVDAVRAVTPAGLFASKSALREYNTQTYGTPGTFTFTVPADVTKIQCQVWAGGGGGGGNAGATQAGGGGGAGGYAEGFLDVTPGQQLTVVVGGRGGGGIGGGANGGVGGSSSIGSISAAGGGGGGTSNGVAGEGGSASGGAFQFPGGTGGAGGYYTTDTATAVGGWGAPSYQQSLILPALPGGGGVQGFGPGAGGSGSARGTNRSGGNGGPGRVVITW